MSKLDALNHAKSVTDNLFGKNQQATVHKAVFNDLLVMTYMLGARNMSCDIESEASQQITQSENAQEELMGILQIAQLESWNGMCETESGKSAFIKMEIEDIIENRPITNFVRSNIKSKIVQQ